MSEQNQYTEDNIRSLDWKEHIRMRPGMYIGKLGDGSSADDGIYILVKEFSITVSMNLQWALEKLLR
jgi:topoisomerase-4 subunit B